MRGSSPRPLGCGVIARSCLMQIKSLRRATGLLPKSLIVRLHPMLAVAVNKFAMPFGHISGRSADLYQAADLVSAASCVLCYCPLKQLTSLVVTREVIVIR